MDRINNPVQRDKWESIILREGLTYSKTSDSPNHYWREDKLYKLSLSDTKKIEESVKILSNTLSKEIVPFILDETPWLDYYGLDDNAIKLIRKSWESKEESFYGRFDFIPAKGSTSESISLKLLEYNADTPTGIIESAISQRNLINELVSADKNNYYIHNSMEEYFIERWSYFYNKSTSKALHLACVNDDIDPSGEDKAQIRYLSNLAKKAGWTTKEIFIDELRWDSDRWVDSDGDIVKNLFKLYPWEDMVFDPFIIDEDGSYDTTMGDILVKHGGYEAMENWFEPAWKMLYSNKILLAVLWDYFSGSTEPEDKAILDLLVPAYISDDYSEGTLKNFVKKPLFGREGDGVEIYAPDNGLYESRKDGFMSENTPEEEYVYQEYIESISFNDDSLDVYPMIGAWVSNNGELLGISIRESSKHITDSSCNFIPSFTEKNSNSFFRKF